MTSTPDNVRQLTRDLWPATAAEEDGDPVRQCVHGYVHEDGHHFVTSSHGGGENLSTSARWEPCPEQTEADVREFAVAFPTPQVLRAVVLCEEGRLTWSQVHDLFRTATAKALDEVTR